jgi:hypothetical protein
MGESIDVAIQQGQQHHDGDGRRLRADFDGWQLDSRVDGQELTVDGQCNVCWQQHVDGHKLDVYGISASSVSQFSKGCSMLSDSTSLSM